MAESFGDVGEKFEWSRFDESLLVFKNEIVLSLNLPIGEDKAERRRQSESLGKAALENLENPARMAENRAALLEMPAPRVTSRQKPACDLITADEVQRITGRPLQPIAEFVPELEENECTWKMRNEPSVSLRIAINDRAEMTEFYMFFKPAPVPGYGEAAFWDETMGLTIFQGKLILNISASPSENEKEWAMNAGKAALKRM